MNITELQSTLIDKIEQNRDLRIDISLFKELKEALTAIHSDFILLKTNEFLVKANSITVLGTASILNLEVATVEATFYADTESVNISIAIKPGPSWKFTDSFPTLPPSLKILFDKNQEQTVSYGESLLGELVFQDATFILQNYQSGEAPNIFMPGLNFSGTPTNLNDFTIAVDQLFVGSSPRLIGHITPQQNDYPQFEFWIVGKKDRFSIVDFSIEQVRHRIRRADPPVSEYPDTRLEIVGNVKIGKANPISIEVFTPIYKNHSTFYFYGYPLKKSATLENGLDTLAEFVGINAGKISLPKEFGVIEKAYLDQFYCFLNYKEKKIDRFFFSVDLPVQWEILPGKLVLSDIICGITILFEKDSEKEIIYSITGVFALELPLPVHLDVTLLIGPKLKIIGQLRDKETLPVPQAITALTGHSIDLPADLMVTRLYIDGEPQDRSFDFQFGISGDFHPVPDFDIKLEQLILEVSHQGGAAPQTTGKLSGKIQVAGINLFANATYAGGNTGWQLEGGATTKNANLFDLVEKLGEQFNAEFELPAILEDKSIEVESVHLSFNTATKAFTFSCTLDFHTVLGTKQLDGAAPSDDLQLVLNVQLSPTTVAGTAKKAYEFTFDGQLIFQLTKEGAQDPTKLEFDLVFDKSQKEEEEKDKDAAKTTEKTLIAAYQDLGGGSIPLGSLLHQLNDAIPDLDFSVDLKQAFLIFDTSKSEDHDPTDETQKAATNETATKAYIFGANIGAGINLTGLPLVGKLLPREQQLSLSLQPYYASAAFGATAIQHFQALLPGEGLSLPLEIKQKGAGITITLNLADKPIHLDLPIALASLHEPEANKSTLPTTVSGAMPSTLPAEKSEAKIKWFPLNKAFGPVHLNRVGVQFDQDKKEFLFQMDGSLGGAGITFSLDGLGMKVALPQSIKKDGQYQIPSFQPSFQLHGLGLDLKKDPLELGGAFLRNTYTLPDKTPYDEYDGILTLSFEKFSMTAIGSYAEVNHHTSLFAYAVLNYPLGGPSFFYVTGLAAGFGYNRTLHLPAVAEVRGFPMVAAAVAASDGGSTETPAKGDQRDYLTGIISSMHDAIPPQIGEYFVAVGVHFTSFKLIDSFVLLAVSFGNKLEIDLLGTSKIVMPAPKEGEDDVPAIAVAELALKGTFIPADGFMGIKMVLTNNSYVFDPNCHLTGGFAFYTWFKGDQAKDIPAGDFVLTIGGYHPEFKVPAHYPSVPRLGFNWQVTDEFHLEGGIYFALTARALMAGGHLSVVYQTDHLKAWFDASADFLISWQPYHYDISLSVHIGVDATFQLFGTQHISMDLGADVHVYGPEFSGEAHISLVIITIPVTFGSGKADIQPITWEAFKKAFLPLPNETATAADKDAVATATVVADNSLDVLQVNVGSGLVKKIDVGTGADKVTWHIINPKEFAVDVTSVVPLTKVTEKQYQDGKEVVNTHQSSFGLAPMAIAKVTSSTLTISQPSDEPFIQADFTEVALKKAMPAAMWGAEIQPETNDPLFLQDALVGVRLTPALPPGKTNELTIDRNALAYEPISFPGPKFAALAGASVAQGGLSPALLNDAAVAQKRKALLEALAMDASPPSIQLAPELVGAFVAPPTLVNLAKA